MHSPVSYSFSQPRVMNKKKDQQCMSEGHRGGDAVTIIRFALTHRV